MTRKPKTRKAGNSQCLNCSTPLETQFCPNCGQKNKDYHLSFKDLFSDIVEDILDVDSRLIQSIKYLFTKPGFLTAEYVKGRRVSYLPPLRLYLVASVVFFLSMTLKTMIPEFQSNKILQELTEFGESDSADVDLGQYIEDLATARHETGLVKRDSSETNFSLSVDENQYDVEQGDFLETFRENFAKMMFLLLPVAALLLKLLYWRRGKLYVEHLIFSLHIHALIFSLLILTVIFDYKLVTWAVILWSLVYVYMAMKFYYAQSHVKTTSKLILLLFSYGISLLLVMTLTLVGTALGLVLDSGS